MSRTAVPARPSKGSNAKQALEELSRPGPHTPLRGDLGMVGIPGILFAPEQGLGLPAVVFGHDWLQPAERYADLLRHLATWGFVTAAPSNHRGPLPSAQGFAADLRTTLDVCVGGGDHGGAGSPPSSRSPRCSPIPGSSSRRARSRSRSCT